MRLYHPLLHLSFVRLLLHLCSLFFVQTQCRLPVSLMRASEILRKHHITDLHKFAYIFILESIPHRIQGITIGQCANQCEAINIVLFDNLCMLVHSTVFYQCKYLWSSQLYNLHFFVLGQALNQQFYFLFADANLFIDLWLGFRQNAQLHWILFVEVQHYCQCAFQFLKREEVYFWQCLLQFLQILRHAARTLLLVKRTKLSLDRLWELQRGDKPLKLIEGPRLHIFG